MLINKINELREILVNRVILAVMLFGVPTVFFSTLRKIDYGWQSIYTFHIIFLTSLFVLFFLRKKISISFKAHFLIALALVTGYSVTYSFGLVGNMSFLIIGIILATIFFGQKTGYYYLAVSIIIYSIICYLYVSGNKLPLYGNNYNTLSAWVAKLTGSIFIAFIVLSVGGKYYELFIDMLIDLINKTKQLESSNKTLEQIFEFLPVPVSVNNKTHKVTYLNRAFKDTFGYTINDINTLDKWYESAYPDKTIRKKIISEWRKSMELAEKVENMHYDRSVVTCKHGETKTVLKFSTKLQDKSITAFIDITKQIEYEQLLKEQKEKLFEQNIDYQKLNKELHTAKEKAEESDKLKSAFLKNLSHEIRTPINGIVGFANMLDETKIADQKEFIDIIKKSSYRLLRVVNHILDISKIETNQVSIYNELINIDELISELYILFEKIASEKNLKLITRIPENNKETMLFSDASKLKQILENLISNAIKFTDSGYIEFGYYLNNNTIAFFVKDTGIGINKEFHESIFTPFKQYVDTKSSNYFGTGLGLAIVKSFTELLNGKISIDSDPGKGSVFTIEINYKQEEQSKLGVTEQA